MNQCLVCSKMETDRDHIKTRGSGGTNDEYNIWHLCRLHHSERHQKGLSSFVDKYPILKITLISKGWHYDHTLKKWIRNLD